MRIAHEQLNSTLTAALAERGFAVAQLRLLQIEAPRPWGVSTNACFVLGKQAAAQEIAELPKDLSKREAKQREGDLAKAAGERLAAEIAGELNALAGANLVFDPNIDNDGSRGEHKVRPCGELPFIERVEAEGAYINFYYDRAALTAHVVCTVLEHGDDFGHGKATGRRIMVEYAQPNTHKDFHVGHLRNASIGQAIANLLEFAGNEVLKATYIGDVGAHVAKAIWGHKHRKDSEWQEYFVRSNMLAESEDKLLYWGSCYRETESLLSGSNTGIDPDSANTDDLFRALAPAKIKSEMAEWLRDWEAGSPLARIEWQSSRDECNEAFREIFNQLQVEISDNYWFFESTVDDSRLGQQTADALKQRLIAAIDDSAEYKGALFVDLEQHAASPVFREEERKKIRKLGKMTILRSDGTSLYQTKELGLAKHKFDMVQEKYGEPLHESLYIVGAEQKLYFEQVFAILRLWGFPNAENCRHIDYALVVLPEGKMSSREGTVVSYRELRDESLRRAEEIAREKGVAGDIQQTARDVAIAAIKFAMLKVTASQQIVFDFEEALSFSGRAAPYLQYAYARAGKLVGDGGSEEAEGSRQKETTGVGAGPSPGPRAAAGGGPYPEHPDYELHESEVELARQLSVFPTVCREAAAAFEPATICTYLYTLANTFSAFYRDCRVLDTAEPQRGFRVRLTMAFRHVMRRGFKLLALPLPEEM